MDYVDTTGKVVDDPDAVSLNSRGLDEATAMQALFADVPIDRAICSGLIRTRETAERVLSGRNINVESDAGFEEIRPAVERRPDYDLFRDVAYSHWRANENGSRFLGGELYESFYARISATMERIVADPDWHDIAVFAHGGTNAAILGWVTGLGLNGFGVFDQATCCLNVIDFDMHEDNRRVVRKVLRGTNITAVDPTKKSRHSGDMEALARYLMSFERVSD